MDKIILFLLLFGFVLTCIHLIRRGIVKIVVEENKALLHVINCKEKENDLLYRILKQIRKELAMLKFKDCPEEEYKNIPLELLEWLEELFRMREQQDAKDTQK